MKKKISNIDILSILICFIFCITIPACGINFKVKGYVIDAETKKPIEGAAVAVKLIGHRFTFGLTSGEYTIEAVETLTDSKGVFFVPNLLNPANMCVYKEGYVCWRNKFIFPTWEHKVKKWEHRKNSQVENGMVIKLERFKEGYSKCDHAWFTVSGEIACTELFSVGEFRRAIKKEDKIDYECAQKERQNAK